MLVAYFMIFTKMENKMNTLEFKQWLIENTDYSKRVVSDLQSRLNRANRILPVYNNELYLFELEHVEDFKQLSCTVRSQLRKAVRLYIDYMKSTEE